MGGSTRGKPRNASDGQDRDSHAWASSREDLMEGRVLGRIDGEYRFSDVSDLRAV